ncbi:MAG: sensor histidine kinase [Bacteroidales bacterium]|nr:sensor histidine kinase [Bacteroidales bacterium]
MRESTRLSLRMTGIISLFYFMGLAYIYLISNIEIGYFLGVFFIFAIFTFWIIRLHTENYIYQKIKVIYKTIKDQKRNKSTKILERKQAIPSIENVHHEVIAWSKEYQEKIQELQSLERYRKEYIGNISHELKTPLFNIQGYISTLLDGGLKDENINLKYLNRTEKSVERLIKIVEELDTISKIESGELILNKSRFNILDLTKEIFDIYEEKANKKSCQLIFIKKYDQPIFVYADREHLHTLLANLISNAIKYGAAKNGKVRLGFFEMDENILIEVSDNGSGIAKEELSRIFERFYRTDKARSRDFGGTGLGLAIVKHIIEAHKQVINVRSTIGLGTTFAFTLKKA